jgi:hypothetical protein
MVQKPEPNFAYAYVYKTIDLALQDFRCHVRSSGDEKSFRIVSNGCPESVNFLTVVIDFEKIDYSNCQISYNDDTKLIILYADLYYNFEKVKKDISHWLDSFLFN